MAEKHTPAREFSDWMVRWHEQLPLPALDFAEQNAALFDAAPDMKAALEAAEYVELPQMGYATCPECGGHDPAQCEAVVKQPCAISNYHGHLQPPLRREVCQLGAALRKARGEQDAQA